MKNIKLLILLVLISTITHSQPSSWGPWNSYPCWTGLYIRFGLEGHWDASSSKHMVWVEFNNRYDIPINFNFRVINPSDAYLYQNGSLHTNDRIVSLQSNSSEKGWNSIVLASASSKIDVIVDKVRFGNIDSRTAGGYANCGSNSNSP